MMNMMSILVVAAHGLNILTGYCGQISVGHAAFKGVGAYAAAMVIVKWGWSHWAALPVAALAAGAGTVALPVAAFGGAILAVGATYYFARAAGGRRTPATLILAGVAVGSFLTAVQTFIQQQSSDRIREVFTWILGRLSAATWSQVLAVLPYVVVSLVALLAYRRVLDVLSVGEEEAARAAVAPNPAPAATPSR